MFDWKDPEKELPPYGFDVLIWIPCKLCREGIGHSHKCIASPENRPENFQIGAYYKAHPPHEEKYYTDKAWWDHLSKDHWSPCNPYRWCYVIPPPGCLNRLETSKDHLKWPPQPVA
jgi:hypothetical protein